MYMSKKKNKADSEIKELAPFRAGGSMTIDRNPTPLQRKYYSILLQNANENLVRNRNTNYFSISLKRLKKILSNDFYSEDNERYKQELEALFQTDLEYIRPEGDFIIKSWAHLITEFIWETNLETGEVKIKYAIPLFIERAMQNAVENSENTLLSNNDLTIITGLKKRYSIILYKLCKNFDKNRTFTLSIEELREIFGIEDKYKYLSRVQAKVLDPSVNELNSNPESPFTVSYKFVKKGPSYTHIKFTISSNLHRTKR